MMRSNIRMTIRPFINSVFSLQATDNQPSKITMHHLPTENDSPEDWNRDTFVIPITLGNWQDRYSPTGRSQTR